MVAKLLLVVTLFLIIGCEAVLIEAEVVKIVQIATNDWEDELLYYKLISSGEEGTARLRSLHNIHVGDTVFVELLKRRAIAKRAMR